LRKGRFDVVINSKRDAQKLLYELKSRPQNMLIEVFNNRLNSEI